MYCIYNKARRLYCRWDDKVIIFDTEEQVYEFMNAVPAFFAGEHNNVMIMPITSEMQSDIDNHENSVIVYSDLDHSKFQKENDTLIRQQIQNEYMKEVLKNG